MARDKTVVIVGAGPVGLACVVAAQTFNPSKIIVVDRDAHRLHVAKGLGATDAIDNTDDQAVDTVLKLTNGRGVDVAIEAIGTPAGWSICEDIVCAGGNIAILGVHGKPVTLHLDRMWYVKLSRYRGYVL